jgi:hypothetical protein
VHLLEFPSQDLSGTTFSVEPRCGGIGLDGVVRGVLIQEIDECCVIELEQSIDIGRRIGYQYRSHQSKLS